VNTTVVIAGIILVGLVWNVVLFAILATLVRGLIGGGRPARRRDAPRAMQRGSEAQATPRWRASATPTAP
jgi:hypothetical protein